MIDEVHGVAAKLKAHNRLVLKVVEAFTRVDQRVKKHNETLHALGAVTINATDRGIVERLETLVEQERLRTQELVRQMTALEAEIISDMERLLAESLRREESIRNDLADMRRKLDELSSRLAGQGERFDGVAKTVNYLIGVVNPVRRSMADNSAALREVRDSVDTSRRAAEGQADSLRALTRMAGDRTPRSLPPEAIEADREEAPSPEQAAGLPEKLIAVMFASNPEGEEPVPLDLEMTDIQNQLNASALGHLVQFELCPATGVTDLFDRLNRFSPRLVHFSGHGTAEGIVLSTPRNLPKLVAPRDLIGVVEATLEVPPVVLFNICDSADFARQAAETVEVAIGMAGQIRSAAARAFTVRFYGAIASGWSVQTAFVQGVRGLRTDGYPDADYPQMFYRPDVDPAAIWLVRRP
jgi:hypothetical protein